MIGSLETEDALWLQRLEKELPIPSDPKVAISFCSLVIDQPARLIGLLKHLYVKGITSEDLCDVLIDFYFMNLNNDEIKENFYSQLKKDGVLKPLYELGQKKWPRFRENCEPVNNLVGDSIGDGICSTIIQKVSPPEEAMCVPFSAISNQWATMWALFGEDLLSVSVSNKPDEQKQYVDCLMEVVKSGQLRLIELLRLTNRFSSKEEREIFLRTIANYYQENFEAYIQDATKTPALFYLLPYLSIAQRDRPLLLKNSLSLYQHVFKSQVFSGLFNVEQMAKFFLCLQSIGMGPSDLDKLKGAFCDAIMQFARSQTSIISVDNSIDISLQMLLESCNLFPLLKKSLTDSSKLELRTANLKSTDVYSDFAEQWYVNSTTMVSCLNDLFPEVRLIYPVTRHELHGVYLEQRVAQGVTIEKALSYLSQSLSTYDDGRLLGSGSDIKKEEQAQLYRVRALTSAYYMTDDPNFRQQVVQQLDTLAQEQGLAVNWRLHEVWWGIPEVSEVMQLRNQADVLSDYLPYASKMEVRYALGNAARAGQLAVVKQLLALTGDNKPDNIGTSNALERAIDAGQLAVVEHLLALTGDNKPDQIGISNALNVAARNGQLAVVELLLALTGDNSPNPEGISNALNVAARNGQLAIVKYLCALPEDQKPDQAAVNEAFINAAYSSKLNVVAYFLTLLEANRPDQKTVGDILLYAVINNRLPLVNQLLKVKVEDAKLYGIAVRVALDNRAPRNVIDILMTFFQNKELKKRFINEGLERAASAGQLAVVEQLLALTGDDQPDKKVVLDAFQKAVRNDQKDVVKFFLLPENKLNIVKHLGQSDIWQCLLTFFPRLESEIMNPVLAVSLLYFLMDRDVSLSINQEEKETLKTFLATNRKLLSTTVSFFLCKALPISIERQKIFYGAYQAMRQQDTESDHSHRWSRFFSSCRGEVKCKAAEKLAAPGTLESPLDISERLASSHGLLGQIKSLTKT